MTSASLILHPPRAYQVVLYVAIGEDARSETEIGKYILDSLNPSLALASLMKGVAVQKIAAIPTGVPPS